MPWRLISRMISKIPRTTIGARPSDGSSIMMSFGLAISARPTASICCSPPESVPACCHSRSLRRGNRSYTRARSSASESLRRYAPMRRFSATVRFEKTRRPSGTSVTPLETIWSVDFPTRFAPSSRISPDFGRTRPATAFSVVDLPAPFEPMRVTILPSSTVRSMPLTASMPP